MVWCKTSSYVSQQPRVDLHSTLVTPHNSRAAQVSEKTRYILSIQTDPAAAVTDAQRPRRHTAHARQDHPRQAQSIVEKSDPSRFLFILTFIMS